jgi:hypothetical protein
MKTGCPVLKPTSISWQTQQVHVLQHSIGVLESAHGRYYLIRTRIAAQIKSNDNKKNTQLYNVSNTTRIHSTQHRACPLAYQSNPRV